MIFPTQVYSTQNWGDEALILPVPSSPHEGVLVAGQLPVPLGSYEGALVPSQLPVPLGSYEGALVPGQLPVPSRPYQEVGDAHLPVCVSKSEVECIYNIGSTVVCVPMTYKLALKVPILNSTYMLLSIFRYTVMFLVVSNT